MLKSRLLLAACAFTLVGISSATAVLPTPAFVDAKNGSNGNAGTGCPVTAPCADLNTALSVLGTGVNVVVIVGGGIFGPVVLNQNVDIIGTGVSDYANILADATAQVGCIGHLPAACGLSNNGYAVEFIGAAQDALTITHLAMRAPGSSGAALKFSSGVKLKLNDVVVTGSDTSPALQLYPSSPSLIEMYVANSQFSGGSGANAGAVEVKPSGNTSVALHFNHDQVVTASYGIRTDGSGITAGNFVSTTISESQFFGFGNAAVNAFSTAGTGTVRAVFDSTRILGAATALKANGPLSSVVLTNNTISGNTLGVQVLNGATVFTSGNNTIKNNTTNVSGTLTAAPMQ